MQDAEDGGQRSAAGDVVRSVLDGSDLVVVSNRSPYEHSYADDDQEEITVDRPAGGLTAALDPVMQRIEGDWIAWGAGEADGDATDDDGRVAVPPEDPCYDLELLPLDDETVRGYYYGYSNRVLWPLCHGGLWQTTYEHDYWEQYRAANRQFGDAVLGRVSDADDPIVWFQDYHFALAPEHVRAALDDGFVMQFWHIPWPGWETFRSSPHAEDLLAGLLGNDLLGFHVDRYCRNFLDCVERGLEGARVDRDAGTVRYRSHETAVRSFPLGVDAGDISRTSASTSAGEWEATAAEYGIPTDRQIVVGVDRLDYTKGIPQRLDALARLWERSPEWRGEFTYVQKCIESRSRIPEYQELQHTVDEKVETVNDRFGTDDWQPVVRVDDYLPREELLALYRHGDVMLVSALEDGMNLVAKEYVAAQVDRDGVLVLSDQVGAHEELGEDAVTINPHDTAATADGVRRALQMGDRERRRRMRSLREQVGTVDIDAWLTDVFETVDCVRTPVRSLLDD